MSDPVLEYLKSVKQDIREMRTDINGMLKDHDNRLDDLETKHAEQRGMVKLAGVLVTTVSGIIAFLVAHFKH
jgi:ribosome recycling factor